ncbi:aminotransferase class III-fold pyridoxal phosphate-dependent enzyme [Alphaproteobacteria bacterium]|nr:aminotransferase class III-fold pyridoxal phosphate-dependent enzyme [Alphaproteobacteria bacterium]
MNKLFNTYNFTDFTITKGNGSYLYDNKKKKYLDFSAGVAVNSLGYNHPIINKTIKDQLKTGIMHLSGSQLHKYKTDLANVLSKNSNKGDIFYSNSGAESIETAMKIARSIGSKNKKTQIISMTSSFHGRTLGAISLGHNKNYKTNIGPIPGDVIFCKFNNSDDLKKKINPKKTIAIIIEFIQGDGGVNICTKEFAKTIDTICKKYRILLIADEIQAGVGRTGKMFAYKNYAVSPDIITMAKGLGSGIPIGATIIKNNLSKKFNLGFHGSTYGGGMLQTRIAFNVFNFINRKSFLNEILEKSKILKLGLIKIKNDHSNKIKEIRISGLICGIEFYKKDFTFKIFNILMKDGLITTIVQGNIIRITPPLTIKKNEIKEGLKIISNNLNL